MNAEFDFDKMSGLLPAVVQDSGDGQVLMVGFMNRQALDQTLETGYVTFYQPDTPEVVGKRRDVGEPAAGGVGAYGL